MWVHTIFIFITCEVYTLFGQTLSWTHEMSQKWILISCICTVWQVLKTALVASKIFERIDDVFWKPWCFSFPCPMLHISDMLSEGRRLMWPICVRNRVRITTTEPALVWCKHIFLFCAVFVFLYLCDNASKHTIRVFALVWCEHFTRFLFLTHLTFDIVCWSVQITGTDMWIK